MVEDAEHRKTSPIVCEVSFSEWERAMSQPAIRILRIDLTLWPRDRGPQCSVCLCSYASYDVRELPVNMTGIPPFLAGRVRCALGLAATKLEEDYAVDADWLREAKPYVNITHLAMVDHATRDAIVKQAGEALQWALDHAHEEDSAASEPEKT